MTITKSATNDLLHFCVINQPQDWAKISGFLEIYVDEKSRDTLMSAYWNAANNMNASTIQIKWKKKDNTTVDSKP